MKRNIPILTAVLALTSIILFSSTFVFASEKDLCQPEPHYGIEESGWKLLNSAQANNPGEYGQIHAGFSLEIALRNIKCPEQFEFELRDYAIQIIEADDAGNAVVWRKTKEGPGFKSSWFRKKCCLNFPIKN